MGIIDTKLCSYCKIDGETILHLSFKCQKTNEIWSKIKEKVYAKGIYLQVLTGVPI